MTPNFHPPDELLVQYASGETSEAVSLVVACHATLCPRCQRHLDQLDAVGGAVLEGAADARLLDGALERTLAKLDEAAADTASPPPSTPSASVLPVPLPRPLLRYLDTAPVWKRVIPGIGGIRLPVGESPLLTRLVRLRPGLTIPLHDHAGPELTLVFAGGLIEPERALHRGDFSLRQPGDRHVQRVEDGSPCIALTVNEAPLVPLTWLGRLLTLIARD